VAVIAENWVTFLKRTVDEHYSDTDCVRVVLDNLSTHTPEAFCEHFNPEEARRPLGGLEFHFTPVHGSCLDTAELD
jgi:hypothetical protein